MAAGVMLGEGRFFSRGTNGMLYIQPLHPAHEMDVTPVSETVVVPASPDRKAAMREFIRQENAVVNKERQQHILRSQAFMRELKEPSETDAEAQEAP
jgi:hypothetical protein